MNQARRVGLIFLLLGIAVALGAQDLALRPASGYPLLGGMWEYEEDGGPVWIVGIFNGGDNMNLLNRDGDDPETVRGAMFNPISLEWESGTAGSIRYTFQGDDKESPIDFKIMMDMQSDDRYLVVPEGGEVRSGLHRWITRDAFAFDR